MSTYLTDGAVFEEVVESWDEVVEKLNVFKQAWEFPTGTGVVYNYGIWKPSKGKFRYISGTRKGAVPQGSQQEQSEGSKKEPPRQPLYHLNKTLVMLLKQVESVLKEKDEIRQQTEGIKAFWGIDSVESFVRMVRSHSREILAGGLSTADFTTMYTAFTFDAIVSRTMESAREAWEFVRTQKAPLGVDDTMVPRLTSTGWSWDGHGYSIEDVYTLVKFSVENNFTCNGGRVRRQVRGMPMGLPPAPQLANLGCYPVERDHMCSLPLALRNTAVARYIDDIVHPSTMPLPTAEQYGMEYKITGSGDSVVCLGVRVYILDRKGSREVHTTVRDREEDYPHHIVRYPLAGTTAPTEQLGGVLMGRFEFARMVCSHMGDFKRSIAYVLRNAIWRGYPRHLVQSVWSRFLFQRWHPTNISVKELRVWFPKVWKYLISGNQRLPPAPWETAAPLDDPFGSSNEEFLAVFGRTKSGAPIVECSQDMEDILVGLPGAFDQALGN